MTNRDLKFDAYVLEIYKVLDRLSYYRLLGIEEQATASQIKKNFYQIAAKFHPDRNRDAAPDVQHALYDIFKRLNEAYRVLSNAEQRQLYHRALARGETRLDLENRRTLQVRNPQDTIQSRPAREFYLQAKEALKAGKVMQAELHIRVAKNHEKNNEAIEALFVEIQKAKKS